MSGKKFYPKWKICLPYWDITCRTLYRLLISVCFRKNKIKIFFKPAGIFSCEYLRYRIRKCSCFSFLTILRLSKFIYHTINPTSQSNIKPHSMYMSLLLTTRAFCCFMFIFMWFIECLQVFLHFTCGFIDIFSKKPFTNPHNRAYNKVTNNKKAY